ncbi:hypothetical protein [Gelidibacter sp. F63206]|uniref:hypothetical protein n=1 Tax=Gelidibacter sp. F63206 TaxID=2926425 RepID=UPI001FF53D90|nr:hypothetical protein [Gelidibacter sp. F63206]MCK0114968.1 hypothetical protein [Gelidibacter sp. F63206]
MFFKKKPPQKSLENDLIKMFDDCIKIALKDSPNSFLDGYIIAASIEESKKTALNNDLELHIHYNLDISEIKDIINRVHKRALSIYLK